MDIKTFNISYDILGNAQFDFYGSIYAQSNLVYKLKFSFVNLGENEQIYINVRRADGSVNANSVLLENQELELSDWYTAYPGVLEISPFIYDSNTQQRKFLQIITFNVIRTVDTENGVDITLDAPKNEFTAFDYSQSISKYNKLLVEYSLDGQANGVDDAFIGSVYRGSNAADLIEVKFAEAIPYYENVVFIAKRPDGTATSEYLSMTRVNDNTFTFYLLDWFTFYPGNLECNVKVFGPVVDEAQQAKSYGIFNIQVKDTIQSSNEQVTANIDNIQDIINRVQTLENTLKDFSSLKFEIVSALPTTNISTNIIYLLPIEQVGDKNSYDEYAYIRGKWELIGTTKFDVSEATPHVGEKAPLKKMVWLDTNIEDEIVENNQVAYGRRIVSNDEELTFNELEKENLLFNEVDIIASEELIFNQSNEEQLIYNE